MRAVLDGGEAFDLGATETAPTVGITDFSRRVTDAFGVTTVVERGFSRRMSVRLALPFESVDALQRRLADLRATAALWVADERYASLSIRGFYKDFDLDLSTPPLSYCTLTVEGLAETETAGDPGGDPAPAGQASTLQLLQPVDVAGGALASSTVPETDAPEWAAGTTYATGARVIRAATHRVFESLVSGNVGHDPAAATGEWLDVGPTNRWAMFDGALGTATTATGSVTVGLTAGAVDAVALLDVVAQTVRVQATGYDRTITVGAGAIVFTDLPTTGGQVTVTISGAGQVSVGTLLVGKLVGLGVTEASPTAAIQDFSKKETDDFGEVSVVERAWAKRMTARALIRTDMLDAVADRIASVRATPSLWIGQAGVDSLTVYGFFKDFSIEVGETLSKLSLSIEGLSAAAPIQPLGAMVNWPDVADPDGTKPADNATNSADPDSPFGPGKTVGQALQDLAYAMTGGNVDLDPLYDAIDQARQEAEATAAQALAGATNTLNNAIANADTKAGQARTIADGASLAITDATSDLNTRIKAATDLGNTAISRVTSLETAIDAAGGLKARISTVETVLNDGATGLVARTQALETSLDTPGSGVSARLSTVEGVLTTPGSGLVSRTATLESDLNSGTAAIKTRLTTVEGALNTPGSGIVSRTSALESSLTTPDTGVLARIDALESTSSSDSAAVAEKVQNLDAQINTGSTSIVSRLGVVETAYADPTTGLVRRINDLNAAISTPDTGISARLGTVEQAYSAPGTGLASRTSALEASVTSTDATLNAPGTGVQARLTTAENALADPNTGLVSRTGTLEAQLAGNTGSNLLTRIATTEQVLSTPGTGVASRTSTLEAQLAGVSGSNLLTRIVNTETAVTDGRFASASRAATLEAQLAGNVGSNLLSRIQNSETAYTDGRFASAQSVSDLSAALGGVSAQASQSYAAVTDGRFASASGLSTLNSQVNGGGGLAATVTQQAATIASHDGKLAAYVSLAANAGGVAEVELRTDTQSGSSIRLKAQKVSIGSGQSGAHIEIVDNLLSGFYDNGALAFRIGVVG